MSDQVGPSRVTSAENQSMQRSMGASGEVMQDLGVGDFQTPHLECSARLILESGQAGFRAWEKCSKRLRCSAYLARYRHRSPCCYWTLAGHGE